MEWSPCGNHQSQILETAIVNVGHAKMQGRLFAVATFLKAADHFKRMVQVVRPCIRQQKGISLTVKPINVHGPHPRLAALFSGDAVAFVVSHYLRCSRAQKDDQAESGEEGDDVFDESTGVQDRGVRASVH